MPSKYSHVYKMRLASGDAKKPEQGHPLNEDPDITVGPGQGFVKPPAPKSAPTVHPGYRDFSVPSKVPVSQRGPESTI